MTTTTARTVSNGTASNTTWTKPDEGLARLRRTETKDLIHLACDAMSETHSVGHQMHQIIYADGEFSPARLDWLMQEALECWQTADHYLRMLASVLAEFDPYSGSLLTGLPRPGEPAS